jgi:hypothetical protein
MRGLSPRMTGNHLLKPVVQIAPLRDQSRDGLTLRVVRQKRIDLIELIGCHELQYLGADAAARGSW